MQVSGVLEDEERAVLDLLAYRMVETATIDENNKRRITYTRRRPAIREAWERRSEELDQLFG